MNAQGGDDRPGRPIWTRGIEGQVAVAAGAGRGLGRACTLALSGARVIAVSRTAGELDSLANEADGPVEAWAEDATGDALPARVEALDRLDVLERSALGMGTAPGTRP